MSRTSVVTTTFFVALAAAFAITWLAVPASAGKPEAVVSTSFSVNSDCSVDFEIDLNSRGRLPSVVVVHYWQSSSRNGGNYQQFGSIERGVTLAGTVSFTPADLSFGTTYDVGYTAFAKNGNILSADTIGWVDATKCFP